MEMPEKTQFGIPSGMVIELLFQIIMGLPGAFFVIKNILSCKDIYPGEELLCDYVEFGKPPQWLINFVKKYDIPLAFEGFNEFVTN